MIETIILLKPEAQWRRVEDGHGGTRRITKKEIPRSPGEDRDPGCPADVAPADPDTHRHASERLPGDDGVKVFGSDPKEVERVCLQMEQILRRVPGATDVVADRIVAPYLRYEIDRAAITPLRGEHPRRAGRGRDRHRRREPDHLGGGSRALPDPYRYLSARTWNVSTTWSVCSFRPQPEATSRSSR